MSIPDDCDDVEMVTSEEIAENQPNTPQSDSPVFPTQNAPEKETENEDTLQIINLVEDENNPPQNISEADINPMADYNLAEQQRFIDMSNSENLPLNAAWLTNQALSHVGQTTPLSQPDEFPQTSSIMQQVKSMLRDRSVQRQLKAIPVVNPATEADSPQPVVIKQEEDCVITAIDKASPPILLRHLNQNISDEMPGNDQIRVLLKQVQHMMTSSNKRSHDLVSQSGDDGGTTDTTPNKRGKSSPPKCKTTAALRSATSQHDPIAGCSTARSVSNLCRDSYITLVDIRKDKFKKKKGKHT